MISWLRDGLSWRWHMLRRYAFLASHFRNGLRLVARYRKRQPSGRAVCWNGTTFSHPPHRTGLAEAIIEIWYDEVYTGTFYRPAPGDTVIDAGANVGLFAVWLGMRNRGCRVLAFEPFEENFRLLQANILAARATNVTALNAGLGGTAGRGAMAAVGSRSLDHRMTTGAEAGSGTVPIYSFAQALEHAGSPRIALFKIDIEGSEYDLFDRAEPADIARVDRFAMEYHDHLKPGTRELIERKLADTHDVRAEPIGDTGYGMLYATRRHTSSGAGT